MAIRQGKRPGDRRMRAERVRPQSFQVDSRRVIRKPPRQPAVVLALGFLGLIGVGTVLLMLPLASADGAATDPITALFTSTSAVCVTGLAVVDTGTHWSLFGQLVILGLMQIGGFGFMTGSTLLLLLLVGRRSSLSDRMLAQQSVGARDLGSVRPILRRAAVFTLLAEGVGAVVLAIAFFPRYQDGITASWHGLFHAVSSFNNAGFDLMGDFQSLTGFADDPAVFMPIGILVFLGGIGVAIAGDVIDKRQWSRFALETKLVLATSAVLTIGGATALLVFEWSNPATLGGLPEAQRPLNALFEAVSFRSGGMTTVPTGDLTNASQTTAIAQMFIGGSSGSTAGGIKLTTFAILLFTILSTVRGRTFTEAFGRRVSQETIARALSIALLGVALAFGGSLLMEISGAGEDFLAVAYETVSAFGGVGSSTGITPDLPDASLLVLIVGMYIGRLGPLTLVLALSARARPVPYKPAAETLRIG